MKDEDPKFEEIETSHTLGGYCVYVISKIINMG
jgi:hypothetical protein